ncbi:hypothetical protein ACQ4PT_000893 [Festuca glaucescens]
MAVITDFTRSWSREIGMAAIAGIIGCFQWRLTTVVTQASVQRCIDPGGIIKGREDKAVSHTIQSYEITSATPITMAEKNKFVPAAVAAAAKEVEVQRGTIDTEKTKGNVVTTLAGLSLGRGEGGDTAGPSRQSHEKQLLQELGTAREKEAIVINMAKARGVSQLRFLAVGIFLSVLTVSSKQLVDSMKKVWKLRGRLDFNPLEGRRFVLEFVEEGDFTHVIRGGPWRYRDDDVLIEALKEGEDPATLPFTSVPIWAQFKDIPFYLLSKKLARDLEPWVRIDINQPLLRWTPLLDRITGEEVIVHIFYDRLPRFCFSCGIIGHGDERCILPMELRSGEYGRELGVPPTHVEDPRCWFLPETTEQERRQLAPTLPWNQPAGPTPSKLDNSACQQAIIAYVAREVGKLSVEDLVTKGDNDS